MSETAPNSACPDAATLRSLLEGTLSDDQLAATQSHVDQCSMCEAALRQMTAGGESWVGMAEKLKGDSREDPKLAAAMERLKTDDGSASESGDSADPQRTLDFLSPSDDPKSLGRLGQHEVLEVIGWGGMGVVLKAYDPGLHRVVAVKVLASHLAHHAVARKRFIREAQAAAAVCHENVVTIHAIDEATFVVPPLGGIGPTEQQPPEGGTTNGTTNAQPKIVMQFVAGGSLQERIDQEAPLELKEILRIAMQTAAGLAAAHAQGVVHRDVKPANILLENGVQRVRLTDFGLARVMDDASLTLSGVIAGTPQYMAPEQAWGRDVDARADLFSLGAVMYAMCSGHSPFRARTTMAVLKRVCEDQPRPLRAINPDIPDWLVAIIEKLLAKNPEDRFQSAAELSDLLSRWLAHVQQPNVVPAPKVIVSPSGGIVASKDKRNARESQFAPVESKVASGQASPVTMERMWMPLAAISSIAVLVIVESWYLLLTTRGPVHLFYREFGETLAASLAHVIGAACCYCLFYVGWNTRSGRVRAAMSIVLAVLVWSFAQAATHLHPPFGLLFLFQALLCGGYLLAIAIGFLRFHGFDLLDLPTEPSHSQPPSLDGRWQLSLKHLLWPMLVTGTALGVFAVLIIGAGETRNLNSYLGFCLIQLAATLALALAFRTAWNTSSWIVWIGSVLFLPAAGSAFLWAATNRDALETTKWVGMIQAVMAFANWFSLLFIRPLLLHGSSRWMSERLSGWQRLFAIACFTIFGTPLVLALMYLLSNSSRPVATRTLPSGHRPPDATLNVRDAFPPDLSSAKEANISEAVKPLLGRWVVVSSEGAALSSASLMSDAAGSSFGSAAMGTAPGPASGGFVGDLAMIGQGASATASPLQWIEFATDHVIVFDGREARLAAEFTEGQNDEPKRLALRSPSSPSSDTRTDWRYGIYRLERDRLIVCWTNNGQPVPTEFVGDSLTELLVLRREWERPSERLPDGNAAEMVIDEATKLPQAVVPFTSREAKALQDAWAAKHKVPIETTNSLGMTFRLVPPGLFDSFQQRMLEGRGFGAPKAPPAVARPLYFATREVSVAQFRKFVEATGYESLAERMPAKSEPIDWQHPGIVQDNDEHPVVQVSWEDAQAFCRWLTETTQSPHRLPTVAEWAFAARGGLAAEVRLKPAANARLKFFDTTAPVGGDSANVFGLHDLLGNVGEWTNQVMERDDLARHLAVGGGFRSSMTNAQTANKSRNVHSAESWLMPRYATTEIGHFDDIGFRVVREISSDVTLPEELWPAVEDLIATRGIVEGSTAKADDGKSTTTQSSDVELPVVVVRGVFPVASLPLPIECLDFEIERAERSPEDIFPVRRFQKLDISKTIQRLEEAKDYQIDPIPTAFVNPVFTMPLLSLPNTRWPKDVVTHPRLPAEAPTSKYSVQHELFRFMDFDVRPGRAYTYRVRLQFKLAGPRETSKVFFTPWSAGADSGVLNK